MKEKGAYLGNMILTRNMHVYKNNCDKYRGTDLLREQIQKSHQTKFILKTIDSMIHLSRSFKDKSEMFNLFDSPAISEKKTRPDLRTKNQSSSSTLPGLDTAPSRRIIHDDSLRRTMCRAEPARAKAYPGITPIPSPATRRSQKVTRIGARTARRRLRRRLRYSESSAPSSPADFPAFIMSVREV